MKYYRLNAELLAPLLVQENRQSNASRGLSYLPGSSLRGALAGQYLRSGGRPEDAAFRDIFLERPACFPDLLPANSAHPSSRPFPMTAVSCKRSPGFRKDGHDGVGDALAALVAAEVEGRPLTEAFVCSRCGQDMKPHPGFWNGDAASPETHAAVLLYQRHTGIDRHTGTVASSIFYTTQGIAESRKSSDLAYRSQWLSGGLFLSDSQHDILSGWMQEPIFAGANRTRGMGEMKLFLEAGKAPDFDLEEWDGRFREKTAGLTGKEIPPGPYFSIGFHSPIIMVDRFLRPSPDIVLDFDDLVPVTQVVRQQAVRGWQSSWGLAKPEDTSLAMGGVCLFRYAGGDREGLRAYLKRLATDGIGLRRAEGFGRIRICDPIHIQEVI